MTSRLKALIAVTAITVTVIAAIGLGYAYTAVSYSEDNKLAVDSIYAVDSKGSNLIAIPQATYYQSGSVYVTDTDAMSVSGTLTITSADADPVIRMWVEFENALTWTALKMITLTIDGGTSYTCFNSSVGDGALQTSQPTDPITTTPGEHTFKIDVVYKANLASDPSAYTGSKIASKVSFVMYDTDPLS